MLLQLPNLVKLKILRALSAKSLSKVSLVSHRMSDFIKNNRKRLVERKIFRMTITATLDPTVENCFDCVVLLQTRRESKPQHIFRKGSMTSLWEWICRNCCNTTIRLLELVNFKFTDEQVDTIERLLRKNKTIFQNVTFQNCLFDKESVDHFLRLAKVFRIHYYTVHDTTEKVTTFLKEENVEQYLPSLPGFQRIMEKMSFAAQVLPASSPYAPARVKHVWIEFTTNELKKALQAWMQGELSITKWHLVCTPNATNYPLMAEALGLPFGINAQGEMVFRNVRGDRCLLRHRNSPKNASAWSLYGSRIGSTN